jgi:hypothetical protein
MRLALIFALALCPGVSSSQAGEPVQHGSVQWERLQQRRTDDGWDRPAYQRRGVRREKPAPLIQPPAQPPPRATPER